MPRLCFLLVSFAIASSALAQQTLLANQRQAVQIHGQQFLTTVYLVKALGGGWQESGP